ncbi:glucose-1-phosphate thymidylyltransferase [Actinocrispum wychmicini]|uniref:Glucose-1-phosphate thymidylyltransferase n=1 Tax=Actinocrispum wychmicini TaxID=1213861 RepID=A0A4R2JXH9_9PSEU|nr:glucose-1-phosphate thymidylyltransferase [Actinocrispum wychmicini]TCO62056.1 glucose-1-phosphate thymidylyltransferase [Actinocrispum wychmicini]
MKALVLAGGSGTRLRPFSHSMPKQLFPVAGKPVLLHCLENIRQAGIREVGLVVGGRHEEIRAAVAACGLDLSITYIPQAAPLGLAHCVLIARQFLADEDFVMYLGDNVLAEGIADLAERFRACPAQAQITVTKVANPQEYGVAEVDHDGRVMRLTEKPRTPATDLAVIGVYFLTPAVHEAVRRVQPSARGELEITDVLQDLVTQGADVRAEVFSGYWKDTGSIEDVLDCNRVLLDAIPTANLGAVDGTSQVTGPVVVEAGARILNSRVVGPVTIGAETVIVDSEIGPYVSVGARCRLGRAGITDSIVLDDARVHDVRELRGSIVGRSAEVTSSGTTRRRVILGDHSSMRIP